MKLTPAMRSDVKNEIEQLEAILTLASANFPRSNRITVETAGLDPKGIMSLSPFTLRHLIDAGRAALEAKDEA